MCPNSTEKKRRLISRLFWKRKRKKGARIIVSIRWNLRDARRPQIFTDIVLHRILLFPVHPAPYFHRLKIPTCAQRQQKGLKTRWTTRSSSSRGSGSADLLAEIVERGKGRLNRFRDSPPSARIDSLIKLKYTAGQVRKYPMKTYINKLKWLFVSRSIPLGHLPVFRPFEKPASSLKEEILLSFSIRRSKLTRLLFFSFSKILFIYILQSNKRVYVMYSIRSVKRSA